MQQLRLILIFIFFCTSCSLFEDSYEYELQKNLKIDDCIYVNVNLAIFASRQLPSENAFHLLSDICQKVHQLDVPDDAVLSMLYIYMSFYKNPVERDVSLSGKALYYRILATMKHKRFSKYSSELEESVNDWKMFSETIKDKAILNEYDAWLIKVTFPETTNPINCSIIENRRERINKFIEKYKSKEN